VTHRLPPSISQNRTIPDKDIFCGAVTTFGDIA
jgi:hypothetical protein